MLHALLTRRLKSALGVFSRTLKKLENPQRQIEKAELANAKKLDKAENEKRDLAQLTADNNKSIAKIKEFLN